MLVFIDVVIVMSRYSSVGIETGWTAGVRFPAEARDFSLLHSVQIPYGSTQPSIQWIPGALSPGLKQLGHKADHSLPASAEIKNNGAITPLPHTSLWLGA
jgi:hypothetical protein